MTVFKEVVLLLSTLLLQHDLKHFEDSIRTISSQDLADSYDFIIVGGGSAGSTLASRLSEVTSWNVLLIEAGSQENALSKTPAVHNTLPETSFDWNYYTTQQERTCKANGGKCQYARGKVLGGSSSINGMIYARGYKTDYDNWGRDNCGWSFEDVEPYFLQVERNTIPDLPHRGRNGPLTVSYPPYASPIRDDIVRAGINRGWESTDCADYEDDCIYATQATISEGRRCSASTAYLLPISNTRSNLHILTNTFVTKVLINKRVVEGVEVLREGKTSLISASKEVILSAGAINSPKILMASGIGNREHLESLGINVIVDLPVGDNLQDHSRVPIMIQVKNGSLPNLETFANNNIQNQYVNYQNGPYSYQGLEVLAFVKVGPENKRRQQPPNIQYHFDTISSTDQYNLLFFTTMLRPKSRGTVRLKSSNPLDDPLINVNYYNDSQDWQQTLEGMKYGYKLFQTEPLTLYSPTLNKAAQPICAQEDDQHKFFNCVIEYYTVTLYHPVGSIKMGSKKNNGVINNNLQIYGIRRLRVADASVPPNIISMNTNAMSIMIGEKAADLIKVAHGQRTRQKVKKCHDY